MGHNQGSGLYTLKILKNMHIHMQQKISRHAFKYVFIFNEKICTYTNLILKITYLIHTTNFFSFYVVLH